MWPSAPVARLAAHVFQVGIPFCTREATGFGITDYMAADALLVVGCTVLHQRVVGARVLGSEPGFLLQFVTDPARLVAAEARLPE